MAAIILKKQQRRRRINKKQGGFTDKEVTDMKKECGHTT